MMKTHHLPVGGIALLIALACSPLMHFSAAHAQTKPAAAVALFKAAESGNATEIRKLIAQGVAVDTVDADGWTPLMFAASEGKLVAVQALVAGGADVNRAAKGGETALMTATLSGHLAIVKYLLSEGADKTAKTAQGLTAADIAERAKKAELAKLLRVAGAKPASGATAADPRKELDARINVAAETFKAGLFEESAKQFQAIVAVDPQHALAWHFLGQSFAATGKKNEARAAYEKVLALQPAGTVADRTRQLLNALVAKIERPKMPIPVNEELLKSIESQEDFACAVDRVKKAVRLKYVVREENSNGSNTETIERDITPIGAGLLETKEVKRKSGVTSGTTYSQHWQTTSFAYGGVGIGSTSTTTSDSTDARGTNSGHRDASSNSTTKFVKRGAACPVRLGAEWETVLESVYTSSKESTSRGRLPEWDSRSESTLTSRCRWIEKIAASSLHPKLTGDAYVSECSAKYASQLMMGGKLIPSDPQSPTVAKSYFIADLGVHFASIRPTLYDKPANFFPEAGHQYRWNLTPTSSNLYTIEQVELEIREAN